MSINVIARKTGGGVVGTLVKGDDGVESVRIIVPRYSGSVDLAQLQWSVALRNAEGETDIVQVENIEVHDSVISFLWVPGGAATRVPGVTQFDVAGLNTRGMVWGSAPYTLHIIDNLGIDRVVVDLTSAICGKAICGKAICGRR